MSATENRPLRVLMVGDVPLAARPGGLARYASALAEALGRRAVEVEPLELAPGEAELPLWSRLRYQHRRAARVAGRVDVVDVQFALYALLPLVAGALRRKPMLVHFHGPWAAESAVSRAAQPGWLLRAKHRLERTVYRRAEVVVTLSEHFAEVVSREYGVDPRRVVVLGPGVDLARFAPGDRAAARSRFGLDTAGFVAVSVRRLDARMGLEVLIDAWARLRQGHPDAVLLIAGEGRERARLEAAAARTEAAQGSIRFLGRISDDELVDLYRAADVSVVPTVALEGFGLVTLESAACGTPAVVTDVAGLPSGVRDLDPSLVVPAGDASALAERLSAAAEGALPDRDACRAHAERFGWDEVARAHVELYRRVLGERAPTVVFLGHSASLSGAELALTRLVPALDGVEAHVILGEDGPLTPRLRRAGATVEVMVMGEHSRELRKSSLDLLRLPLRAGFDATAYSLRLASRLRRLRPDVLHTNTLKAALYGGFAGRLAGVPVLWHVRDRISPDYLPGPAVWLMRIAARLLPSAIVANSQATRETICAPGVEVIPDPLGAPAPDSLPRCRAERIAAGSPVTVGIVGRLAPWKGQDVFLRAFAQAFGDPGCEVRARIVGSALFGEDEWEESLSALAAELGVADRVDLVGFVEDVRSEYERLDVLVHASTLPEPFGQVIVEGMAAGLAVVATDAGGPAEIVNDGVDGLLFPIGDVGALAERLLRLASDPELRLRLGEAALLRARDFNPDRVAAALEDVYARLMRREAARIVLPDLPAWGANG